VGVDAGSVDDVFDKCYGTITVYGCVLEGGETTYAGDGVEQFRRKAVGRFSLWRLV
jgi:hypothetical protein